MKPSKEALSELAILEERYKAKVKSLLVADFEKNDPYQVGDIIMDNFQIGKIYSRSVRACASTNKCTVIYFCDRLNVSLTPYQGGQKTLMFRNKIKKVLKKAEKAKPFDPSSDSFTCEVRKQLDAWIADSNQLQDKSSIPLVKNHAKAMLQAYSNVKELIEAKGI